MSESLQISQDMRKNTSPVQTMKSDTNLKTESSKPIKSLGRVDPDKLCADSQNNEQNECHLTQSDECKMNPSSKTDTLSPKQSNWNLNFENVNERNIQRLKSLNAVVLPVRYSSKFYRRVLSDGFGVIAVDDESGETVGGASCLWQEDGTTLYIATIGVHGFWRQKGIGSLIIKHLIHLGRDVPSIQRVCLHCRAHNSGTIAFYESNGFKIVNQIEKFYQKSYGNDATAVYMQRDLRK